MSTFDNSCLGVCSPTQILNIDMAVNDPSDVKIYDGCNNPYLLSQLQVSYSTDGICWSCWMTNEEAVENTLNEISDFFIRFKVPGDITKVEVNGEDTNDYTTSLDSDFNSSSYCGTNNYSPYANIDGALQLQQSLSDQVTCTVGIPIYYFKAGGKEKSADMTFKEYALKSIKSVKQLKMVVGDGQMPSSKPEFSELGLDWQVDWQTEISKSQFATAFGIDAQPMEGDLVYVPMQKRMWMVNEAYDERNGSLMWQSTTFQLFLTKYQQDASMDLNVHEDFVNELVKNTYDDIFGKEEPLDSGVDTAALTHGRPANLYPVFQSDATRKEMTCRTIDFQQTELYHRSTLVMDNCYRFNPSLGDVAVTYQKQWCGDELTLAFIINVASGNIYEGELIRLGHITVNIKQDIDNAVINMSDKSLTIPVDTWHVITIRFSRALRTLDMQAVKYTYPSNIPLYKLTKWHYYFDVDHAQKAVGKWNEELQEGSKQEVILGGFYGCLSNFKVFETYNNNFSELLQQYPTNASLLINDTARPVLGLPGFAE